VLTNIGKSLPIKAAGHADLFEDGKGNWWAVCLGMRPLGYPFRHNLGRETFLVPVKRTEDGWFHFGEDRAVLPEFHGAPEFPFWQPRGYVPGSNVYDNFQERDMHPMWNCIYNPERGLIERTPRGLELSGNRVSLWHDAPKAWLGRRQEHVFCVAETVLDFYPTQDREEAGMTIYMNPGHHYEIAKTRLNGQNFLLFRRCIGTLHNIEALIRCNGEAVSFRLECTRDWYQFFYAFTEGDWVLIGSGETQYLTTEAGGCFTGNYIGLYASGNGEPCVDSAVFSVFRYWQEEEEKLQEVDEG
jgi:alpha-N-arabinofuranosidase